MAECLAKVLEKLAEEGKLQSTLTVLENAASTSTKKEPQSSSERMFSRVCTPLARAIRFN